MLAMCRGTEHGCSKHHSLTKLLVKDLFSCEVLEIHIKPSVLIFFAINVRSFFSTNSFSHFFVCVGGVGVVGVRGEC